MTWNVTEIVKCKAAFLIDIDGDFKGGVTAVFCDNPEWANKGRWLCYAHTGQHSECSREWAVDRTERRNCTMAERQDLLAELASIGYDVEVVML